MLAEPRVKYDAVQCHDRDMIAEEISAVLNSLFQAGIEPEQERVLREELEMLRQMYQDHVKAHRCQPVAALVLPLRPKDS